MANVAINKILFKRANTAVSSVYTGPVGEIVIDTDLDSIRVQDGVNAGGTVLATQAALSNATANVTSLTSNAASQQSQIGNLIANTAVLSGRIGATESNITLLQADVTTLFANAGAQAGSIGSLTANAAVQAGELASLTANAASQSGLIATLQTQVYGNANVATYLPVYSGNTAAVLTTASQPYVTAVGTLTGLSSTGIIYANANISASGTTSTASGSFRVLGGMGVTGNLLAGSIENTPIGTFYSSYAQFTYAFFTLGGDSVVLNASDNNRISFGTIGGGGGIGAPTFTNYSNGAKIVLWRTINSAGAGHSIGYESGYTWFGANTASASQGFKWYGGTTLAATLSGTGNFTLGGTGNLQAVSALISGNVTASGLSTTGSATINGSASVGGSLLVTGNLTVQGTTTTVNSTTLDVVDKNITVAKGSASAAAANGAGLTIDGASATLLYASTGDRFEFNKDIYTSGNILATNITNLESNAAVQAGAIGTLTANAAVQSGDIATIYANLGAVSGSLATIDSNAAVQAGLIASLESNAAVQAGLIAGLESNAAVQAGLIASLTSNAGAQSASLASLESNAAVQAGDIATLFSNAAVQAGDIATLFSNAAVQAGLIAGLDANAAVQAGAIATLESNAASQAGAIATLQSQVYSNVNVASYLPTYSGNLATVTVTDTLTVVGNVTASANLNVTGYINGKRQALFRKHSTSQNVNNNSDTLVLFDTVSVTVGNCGITYNSTTLPGRFYNATTEPKLVQVSATVVFEGNVSGSSGDRTVWISQGTSTNRKAQQSITLSNSTGHISHTVSTALYLASGENFDVYCRQNSGSALLIGATNFGSDSGSYITITEV